MTRIIEDTKYDFSDVLIIPKRSELISRADVVLEKKYNFKNSGLTYTGIPICLSNMSGVGTFEAAKTAAKHNLFTCLIKHYSLEELVAFFTINKEWAYENVSYSLGMAESDIVKYNLFKQQADCKFVTCDVANAYSEKFIDFIKSFRETNPNKVIIAGNVATPEIAEELLLAGADIVKVGLGSGNACSTRIKTGIGYPQLSAVIECSDAVHGLGGHIISDGGIQNPGDIAKAFSGGSDMVMCGSFFSGTIEGGGEIETDLNGNQFVTFFGMSSKTAQEKYGSGLEEYRASEGRVLKVPFKGSMEPIILDILGSLRSTCTYVGAHSLKELPKRTTFIKVNRQISTLYGVGELMK